MSELKCRVCTKTAAKDKMQHLFKRRQRNKLIQIQELTGLEIRNVDDLPKYICLQCDKDLEHAYSFRCLCIKSQDYFNGILQTNDCLKEEEKEFVSCTVSDIELTTISQQNDEVGDYLKIEMNTELSNLEPKEEPIKKKREQSNKNDEGQDKSHKDIICDKCGNHFTSRQHFFIHMRRHIGDKRYNCEVCPGKFYTQGELKRHMRSHTGERPFACSHCDRRFTDYSTRRKHERIHTNERPYGCEQCGKSFTTSYVLKNHMLTHTGERSFRCEMCEKSFGRQTNLVTHYRSLMHKQNALLKKQDEKTSE